MPKARSARRQTKQRFPIRPLGSIKGDTTTTRPTGTTQEITMLELVNQQLISGKTSIWEFSEISSPEKRIAAQLVVMAALRQASVTKMTISLYSRRLSVAPLDLVERALIEIGESPRK